MTERMSGPILPVTPPPLVEPPLRIISSTSPVRIADFGGWTDTWFAEHGCVLSFAVTPCAEVQLRVYPRSDRPAAIIYAENFGQRYAIDEITSDYDRHPLLEAALDHMKIPRKWAIEIDLFSEIPVGCSTGTSAAVSVAMLGALDRLTPGRFTPLEISAAAHHIETELLHQQCGIQDQLASAHGGICFIRMGRYPHAQVSQLTLPESTLWELERRLALVYVGHSHDSSKVHEQVIRELEGEGADSPRLVPLREMPEMARAALVAGDFAALAEVMIRNTEAQRRLHAGLIGPMHQQVIEVAREYGAIGWKVNGAGGDGGSVTLLCGPVAAQKRQMLRVIAETLPKSQNIPIQLSHHGLRVWES